MSNTAGEANAGNPNRHAEYLAADLRPPSSRVPKIRRSKQGRLSEPIGTAHNPASLSADYDDWDGFCNRRAGYLWPDFGAFGDFHVEDFGSYDGGVGDLRESSLDVASLAKQVSAACKTARRDKASTPVINALEDLTLFLREPGITPEMAHAYINLRIDVLACILKTVAPLNF